MNEIIIKINERSNEYLFDVINEKDTFQMSLKKKLNDVCNFYRNQSISLNQLKEQYKNKSKLSKIQLVELRSNMVFLYTMQCILKYVVDKMDYKIVDHDFTQYKELKGIEVLIHEK